jgi:hypothetical protein
MGGVVGACREQWKSAAARLDEVTGANAWREQVRTKSINGTAAAHTITCVCACVLGAGG